jgi:hypothetical protein
VTAIGIVSGAGSAWPAETPHSSTVNGRGRVTCVPAGVAVAVPLDFYDYARASVPHPRRNRRVEVWQPLITDDLPDRIPIIEVELDILEAHFADLLDELFGARR